VPPPDDPHASSSRSRPRRLGAYRLLRPLARGGMGEVHEVLDESTGAHLALKTLLPEGLGAEPDPEERLRFRREAEVLARLEHPHVVRVRAAELDGPVPFLVQDLLPGGSLDGRLRRGPLPVAEAVTIARKLADALAYAHAHGVLHRDLKPANVLFDDRGEPRLVDFGLASDLREARRLTQTGATLGTPHYMAPEQATGERRADRRTDVYGLAALLYHMLTGRPPFPGDHAVKVMTDVLEKPPAPPRALRPDVPPALEAAVLRGLAKAPEDRFDSVAELGAALEAAFADGSGRLGGRAVPALGVMAVLSLLAGGAALAWRAAGSSEPGGGGGPAATASAPTTPDEARPPDDPPPDVAPSPAEPRGLGWRLEPGERLRYHLLRESDGRGAGGITSTSGWVLDVTVAAVRSDGIAVLEGEVAAIHGLYPPILDFDTREGRPVDVRAPEIRRALGAVEGSPIRLEVDPRTGACLEVVGPPQVFGADYASSLGDWIGGRQLDLLSHFSAATLRRYFDTVVQAHPGDAPRADAWLLDDQTVYVDSDAPWLEILRATEPVAAGTEASTWDQGFVCDFAMRRVGDVVRGDFRPGSSRPVMKEGYPVDPSLDVRSGERVLRFVDGALVEARVRIEYLRGEEVQEVAIALVRLEPDE